MEKDQQLVSKQECCNQHVVRETPMMLNAWTQTSPDFDTHATIDSDFKNEVMMKFQKLEEELRAQSARINELSKAQSNRDQKPDIGLVSESETPFKYQREVSESPEIQENYESVKYRIIADGDSINGNLIEPIEIQVADEDGSLSLNNAAGRVEICLSNNGEESLEIVKRTENIEPTLNRPNRKRKMILRAFPLNEEKKALSESMPPNKEDEKLPFTNCKSEHCDSSLRSEKMVSLGPNNTQISESILDSISWTSTSFATRKLLMAMFDRQTLATHSMTGKPSPAFKNNKPQKKMLDQKVISDIIFAVMQRCGSSEREIRNAITTKCADENKMLKLQLQRNYRDKENTL